MHFRATAFPDGYAGVVDTEEERIALFLDYENLAIGARDNLDGMQFDLRPVLDALAERGRVIARKAYADWSYFDEDRRMLTRSHVELIEIPQRMGASARTRPTSSWRSTRWRWRSNATTSPTFVICTGDSDFTPLVHKLRELNKRVIGVGIKDSTSALLPPACDEFLFYDTLEGVEVPAGRGRAAGERRPQGRAAARARAAGAESRRGARGHRRSAGNVDELAILIAQTLAGLQRILGRRRCCASSIKRALLRKDPTFSEADYGFRAFGELLRHLAERNVVELSEGSAKGDPEVSLPVARRREGGVRRCCARSWRTCRRAAAPPHLSGLKNQVRKVAAGLQREEVRLPGLPAVLQGGRDPGPGEPRVGRGRRGLHRHRQPPSWATAHVAGGCPCHPSSIGPAGLVPIGHMPHHVHRADTLCRRRRGETTRCVCWWWTTTRMSVGSAASTSIWDGHETSRRPAVPRGSS